MSVNIKIRDTQEPSADIFIEKDLRNISSFRKWLRNNLIIYKDIDDTDVPNQDVLIYLNHIEAMLVSNDIGGNVNRSAWVKRVGKRIIDAKSAIKRDEGAND